MKNLYRNILVTCLAIVFSVVPVLVYGGTTGKISGIAKDAETNEPLPGCNIIIEGTNLGAASNLDGEFFILNIPPGTYTVRATMIGYKTYYISNVRILIDLTTTIDFLMETQVLDMEEEVVVIAERPLIQKDVTSKLAIVSSEEILNMPVNSIQDILTTKAGFSTDADGQLHVRGGRAGEIAFMVDGVRVDDPLYNVKLNDPTYSGFSNALNKDAINEMVVISGTFNAEYGGAMSSIVNIVTKDGSDSFNGKLEYTAPMLNKSPYRSANPFPGVQDQHEYDNKTLYDQQAIPIPGRMTASLSGPILPKLTFFVIGCLQERG